MCVCVVVSILIYNYEIENGELRLSRNKNINWISKEYVKKISSIVSLHYPQVRPSRGNFKQIYNYFKNIN